MLSTAGRTRLVIASILPVLVPTIVGAQARVIRVVSSDGQPIAYANINVEGGLTQITDERGEVSLGAGKRQTLTVNVKRIGFTPWFGKMELPDTAAVLVVPLTSLAQTLPTVNVAGEKTIKSPLVLSGFYDRWLMRQKGGLSGQQQYPPKGAGVDIDMLLNASDVAAIEVYASGENMPVNFQFQDSACGVLAFWTGSRKP